MITRLRRRFRDTERGSLTPGAVILVTGLLLIVGLVVDGGRHLNALDQAGDVRPGAVEAAAG